MSIYNYVESEVNDSVVRAILEAYLRAGKRLHALKSDCPIWTRHDRASKPGEQLTSHGFAKKLKEYGKEAGIRKIHIHQTRHSFARIVFEETGSITETQDALGHKKLETTRVYVSRIVVKKDKHSRRITSRLKVKP